MNIYQDDNQIKVWKFEEHEDVDEDENEEEMNVSIIHHKQTFIQKNSFLKKDEEDLTVPGGILKLAVKTGTSASRLVSSFSPGGTNSELHNNESAKLLSNNF